MTSIKAGLFGRGILNQCGCTKVKNIEIYLPLTFLNEYKVYDNKSCAIFNTGIKLENEVLLLRPVRISDFDMLKMIANPSIWDHTSTVINNDDQLMRYLQMAVEEWKAEKRMQFTIIENVKAG